MTIAQMKEEERSKIEAAGIELRKCDDFLTAQSIERTAICSIRDISHEWSDEEAVQILGQTAEAMESGRSRLPIEDQVVDEVKVHYTAVATNILMLVTCNNLVRRWSQSMVEWRRSPKHHGS